VFVRWLCFEHVPERVAAPGFLSGRRYMDQTGHANRYVTLYDLETLTALDTPEYADLPARPTPWSPRMRPGFRSFLRIPCRTVASEGTGQAAHAGILAVTLPNEAGAEESLILTTLHAMLASQAVSAFHLGRAESIPAYGVFSSPEVTEGAAHFVVAILEATTAATALSALKALSAALSEWEPRMEVLREHCVSLAFAVERAEVVAQWGR
jgi:hypothetical protein